MIAGGTRLKNMKIIAEIGINHGGSMKTASNLIKAASDAGVDAVKFQYRNLGNIYIGSQREIGDEILVKEISKNYLSPEEILGLTEFARSLNLEVGISFFDEQDLSDFGGNLAHFDFFKIPSVELTNSSLIHKLNELGKHLYLSLGMHNEDEIEDALSAIEGDNWTPMHCISNYPVSLHNVNLGYLTHLSEKWGRGAGYSSHDDHWEVCLLAMQLGVTVIERHITFDKKAEGLDNSSSSTPDEFSKMVNFFKNMPDMLKGNSARVPNQGELINRQNLGRSYFTRVDIKEGESLSLGDLLYRSPYVGLNKQNINAFVGKPLLQDVKEGAVITKSFFSKRYSLPDSTIDRARDLKLALPVRLHDFDQFAAKYPLNGFEFHLSFGEVLGDIDLTKMSASHRYSVHLPDYVSSNFLMDPFSNDSEQRALSLEVLDRTANLAKRLQDKTGYSVPIVGSFSQIWRDRSGFFSEHSKLFSDLRGDGVQILPQWLPPFAWYFGGSVKLHAMNDLRDVEWIEKLNLDICMDVSHLLMGGNYFNFDANSIFERLKDNTKHIHIADSSGVDGEGFDIGLGDPANLVVLTNSLTRECMKVIEVWQGHLNDGEGFGKAIESLVKISEK